MAITRFEDLIAWHDRGRAAPKARSLTVSIYEVTRIGDFAHDFGLRDQIQRASVSIMSNLAEGFERGTLAEFQQFLSIAKASCAEVRSQPSSECRVLSTESRRLPYSAPRTQYSGLNYVAQDIGYLDQATFDRLREQAEEVGRVVGGLRSSVQHKRESG